jgi:dCTP deaminase
MIMPWYERTKHNGVTYGLGYCGYDIRIKNGLSLGGQSFAIASSIEQFNIPLDLVGVVHDKSTWARCGLSVFNTVLEPGWSGWLTLEFANHSDKTIYLEPGTSVAQIIFDQLDMAVDIGYSGKYHNAPDKPQNAIFEKA